MLTFVGARATRGLGPRTAALLAAVLCATVALRPPLPEGVDTLATEAAVTAVQVLGFHRQPTGRFQSRECKFMYLMQLDGDHRKF